LQCCTRHTSLGRGSPYVVVIGNEKGGSGKTTLAMHLAVALLKEGQRVGTIDLRQQSEGPDAIYSRLAGGAALQYTRAGRQIMPSDEGLVKAMLTSLLRSDLDFMKSANLAGYMTTNLWKETQRNTTKPEKLRSPF
jgi:hypothetical protein